MTIRANHNQLLRKIIRLILPIGAVFVFSLYVTHVAPSGAATATVIQLPSQVHDFGPLMPFSKSEFTFTTKNALPDTLYIDRVAKSCGCTAAQCTPAVVLPGQTFTVKATLSTRGDIAGISSHITVYGHSRDQSVAGDYQLLGVVENAIEFPEEGGGYLRIGGWAANQLPTETLVTVKRGIYPIKFDDLRVNCDSPILSTNVTRLTNDTWRVAFRLSSSNLIGTFGYPVTFQFLRQGTVLPQTVQQQAYVELIGPFVASPTSVLLTPSPGQNVQKVITIAARSANAGSAAPQIISVSSSSTYMTAVRSGDVGHTAITLEYSAPAKIGADSGEIIIFLSDHGKVYKLRVGFLAMIS